MSAYLVGNEHIQVLIDAGLHDMARNPLTWYVNHVRYELNETTADRVGQVLSAENLKSVTYRYPGNANQDPVPVFKTRLFSLRIKTRDALALLLVKRLEPVFVLKAIDCYEYQSCEHDGWETSEAKAFCVALRSKMIMDLPGYDKARAWPVGS